MSFADIQDSIETLWEALTPPGVAAPSYRRAVTPAELKGDAAHRMFFFRPIEAFEIPSEQGGNSITYLARFEAVLVLWSGAHDLATLAEAIEEEAHALTAAVATAGSWPSGTLDGPTVVRISQAAQPDGQFEVTLEIQAMVRRSLT